MRGAYALPLNYPRKQHMNNVPTLYVTPSIEEVYSDTDDRIELRLVVTVRLITPEGGEKEEGIACGVQSWDVTDQLTGVKSMRLVWPYYDSAIMDIADLTRW